MIHITDGAMRYIKKKGKNLTYIADKDKLKEIYDLLGI